MNTTETYQLNQWEATDRIMREDFNADNAKIEAALAAGLKIATGTFEGTGSTGTRTYTIGVKPKLLFARTDNVNYDSTHDEGLVATDSMCITFSSSGNSSMNAVGSPCTLLDDGFSIKLNSTVNKGLDNIGSTLYYWVVY